MQKIFGRAVLIALVAFGLWYVISHYHGGTTFGCQPSEAVATAGSGDCPTSIREAAVDPRWAADRWATIKNDKITTGLFYDQDGNEHEFISGEDTDAARVSQILRAAHVAFPPGATTHPAASHVETKAAARMRDNRVTAGVVVINNWRGVCGGGNVSPDGCMSVLPVILPRGTSLVVRWHGPNGMTSARFVGH